MLSLYVSLARTHSFFDADQFGELSLGKQYRIRRSLSDRISISGGNMAIDVYLQIDGIKGESTDHKHIGWIECESVQWAVSQPKSLASSTGGGHTVERCIHRDIVIRKFTDMSTPALLQTCSMGKTIPKAKIEFMRADGHGEPIKYFEIELENVLIGDVAPEIYEGETMSEHLGLKYAKVSWRYVQQRVGGGAAGMMAGGWDLSANCIA